MLEDLLGRVAEQKEVQAITDTVPEAASQKAVATFELLGRLIDFDTSIDALLAPIIGVLEATADVDVLATMKRVLLRIRTGLLSNESMSRVALLGFVRRHVLVDGDVGAAERQEATAKARAVARQRVDKRGGGLSAYRTDTFLVPANPRQQRGAARDDAWENNRHLLADLSLALFSTALSRRVFDLRDDTQRAELDSFVPLLADVLDSRHDALVDGALSSLSYLVTQPLPSLDKTLSRVARRTFALLERLPASSPLVKAALRLVTVVLRQGKGVKFTREQLAALTRFVVDDIDKLRQHSTTFALLRAVLHRALLIPDLYELMTRVATLMVRCETAAVRDQSRSLFVLFLVNYPLGSEALQRHLSFGK